MVARSEMGSNIEERGGFVLNREVCVRVFDDSKLSFHIHAVVLFFGKKLNEQSGIQLCICMCMVHVYDECVCVSVRVCVSVYVFVCIGTP